jgi:hypothetical protein
MFPSGIVIFFRQITKDESLARAIHPRGRDLELRHGDYYIVDDERNVLGIYPRDWIAAILPLEIVGPGAPSVTN